MNVKELRELKSTAVTICNSEGVISVKQAAEFLSCTERHIWYLMVDGKLPFFKDGRLRRIPRRALREYVDRHTFWPLP